MTVERRAGDKPPRYTAASNTSHDGDISADRSPRRNAISGRMILTSAGLPRAALAGLLVFFASKVLVGGLSGGTLSAGPVDSIATILAIIAYLAGIGALDAPIRWFAARPDLGDQPGPGEGWWRYFTFNPDHKVIGVQYIFTAVLVFLLGGALALVFRTLLAFPGQTLIGPDVFVKLVGLHGIMMIAVALIAVVGGLGNYLLPLMVGARDMAFPRINALTYWLLPPAAVLLLGSFPAGGFDSGWTAYAPLSVKGPLGQQYFIYAVILVGFSSILGAINFVVTTLKLRTPGLTVWRIPIFIWAMFSAALIILLSTSFLAGALTLVLLDRTFNTAFFDPARGGQPLLYQHLFWFYSHPAVYIMAVPAFGVLLEILPVFCRKPLFAYRLVVMSFLTIVFLGMVVWAHHLFVAGMPEGLRAPFLVATELISIPTGAVFLAALGTIWRARMRLEVPMLFVLGSVVTFLVGGITGIYLADVPTDMYLSGTYFLPAHFHYTIVGGTIFNLMAGTYFWFPKIRGRMMFEKLGRLHFALFFVGFHLTFLPMFWLGMNGMPRRYATYNPTLHTGNVMATAAAYLMGLGVLVFVVNLLASAIAGKRALANPWRSRTLEWQTSSPPPPHNFEAIPVIKSGPYDYGDPQAGEPAVFPSPISSPEKVFAC